MPQNLVEKIAQRFAVGLDEGVVVNSGDFISTLKNPRLSGVFFS